MDPDCVKQKHSGNALFIGDSIDDKPGTSRPNNVMRKSQTKVSTGQDVIVKENFESENFLAVFCHWLNKARKKYKLVGTLRMPWNSMDEGFGEAGQHKSPGTHV